jgi:type II secretory pathway pseudopilin PulG
MGFPPRIDHARLWADERGTSLLELLVTMATFGFVMAAILSLVGNAGEQQPKDQERAIVIREAQSGLDRMDRELRQAYKVLDAQPKSMYVLIGRATPPDLHVRYDCGVVDPKNSAYTRCLRWQAPVGQPLSAGSSEVVVRRVSSVLFNYSPGPLNPKYVKTRLAVPQTGERKGGYRMDFVLNGGFYLRNLDALG